MENIHFGCTLPLNLHPASTELGAESVGKGLISTFNVRQSLFSTFEHYVRYGKCRLGDNRHLGGTLELNLHPSSTELGAESVGKG